MTRLHYRGIPYKKSIHTLEVQETEIKGKYRGATCYLRFGKVQRVSCSKSPRKYRGITYGI
ncbi:MAG: DUF4278 domain-containing protein [Prochloraceae cyanobacterium]|nr:DUF4278 domain-containing protein [Prochloraceae cyanobacterium]